MYNLRLSTISIIWRMEEGPSTVETNLDKYILQFEQIYFVISNKFQIYLEEAEGPWWRVETNLHYLLTLLASFNPTHP